MLCDIAIYLNLNLKTSISQTAFQPTFKKLFLKQWDSVDVIMTINYYGLKQKKEDLHCILKAVKLTVSLWF